MAKRWMLYLPVLAGMIGFYIAYQGWLAWLLLAAVLCLPLMSLAVSLPAMWSVSAVTAPGGYLTVGANAFGQVKTHCSWPQPPVGCRLKVERPLTGDSWYLKRGQALPCDHAGLLVCRPAFCRVYDYLGLFFLPVRRKSGSRVILRPVPVPMPERSDLREYLGHAWRPKPGGGFGENHEMRLYRPGDPVNQVHWKLTAKTGKLMIREPMELQRKTAVISLDLAGTPEELDRKLGRLLWLGRYLAEHNLPFTLRCLTGKGLKTARISGEAELLRQLDGLLGCPPAAEGTAKEEKPTAAWYWHIGGDADEA